VFADTRDIHADDEAKAAADRIGATLGYDDEKKFALFEKLNKRTDPYEPIQDRVDEETADAVRALNIAGVGFVRQFDRFYPEGDLAAAVIGFVGKNEQGDSVGRYGVEGYWDRELRGTGGFLEGFRSATGGWIPLAKRVFRDAKDGSDIILTIDRSLQHYACERLRRGMEEYEAASAALIIMDPETGAIRASCSLPDFDPNAYRDAPSAGVFNNAAIFTPYEPGSIFKPITMAAAINEDAVTPDTAFTDTGSRDGLCQKPIKNAGEKSYGRQTMTGVLQNSINTGMVFVAETLGKKLFREYVHAFGFGVKEGIELDTESEVTVDSLSQNSDEKLDCYAATGSFGQGITVTPLQMATAFSAIANGGRLMKPMIVQEVRHSDGTRERMRPKEIRQVITPRTASLVAGMLTQVVEHGYGGRAQVRGYYVGGKTGTAQIPGPGGYTDETIHSFVGFAPLEHPKFVMAVKFEKPERTYAEVTAAPVFADIATFALQYYEVPPSR
jgi:cell division protein FtsI/penicillin-binding protein 2